jgi:hypothetical protein
MDKQALTHELREHRLIGRGHEHEPLVDYALLATTFATVTGGAILGAVRQGACPTTLPIHDAALLGLATARLARLVTREKVTRPLRAPFTEKEPDADPDEVSEQPRGEGLTRAIGELLTCPRCFAMWASSARAIAFVFAPGPTRVVSGLLAASLISDWVNIRFAHAREQSQKDGEHRVDAARTAWGTASA